MGAPRGILEGFVDFRCEVSVIVARGADGALAAYPAVENRHVNHILDTTIAPASLPPETAREAETIARDIAARLDLVGVLAVEMFVTTRRQAAGQRAGAAAAQFRALDDRRLRHQPVRAAGAGDLRPAARLDRAPLRRGDEEPDRRRGRDLARRRSPTRRARLHLYGKTHHPPRPQDGPRHPAAARGQSAELRAMSRRGYGRLPRSTFHTQPSSSNAAKRLGDKIVELRDRRRSARAGPR